MKKELECPKCHKEMVVKKRTYKSPKKEGDTPNYENLYCKDCNITYEYETVDWGDGYTDRFSTYSPLICMVCENVIEESVYHIFDSGVAWALEKLDGICKACYEDPFFKKIKLLNNYLYRFCRENCMRMGPSSIDCSHCEISQAQDITEFKSNKEIPKNSYVLPFNKFKNNRYRRLSDSEK